MDAPLIDIDIYVYVLFSILYQMYIYIYMMYIYIPGIIYLHLTATSPSVPPEIPETDESRVELRSSPVRPATRRQEWANPRK